MGGDGMATVETAYFAGGCFWCITPTFREAPGVLRVVSGYSGGDEHAPTYEDVKSQKTGHRETIELEYLPEQVSYGELLDIFLSGVDPFDPDGQFIDRGHSYTLAVYYLNDVQRQIAAGKLRELEESAKRQVNISLEPFRSFYPAEEYHQDYDQKHPLAFQQELLHSGRNAFFSK